VRELLSASPQLVRACFKGEAWRPGQVYDCDAGGPVATPDGYPFSNTALHTAAVLGRAELARVLLEHGADPNDIGYEGNKGLTPPLVLAAWEGNFDTLRILLDFGADPNLPASAETALYTAAEHGALDKVDLLLERGARHDIFTAA
jgi:ankyrin repeat protein